MRAPLQGLPAFPSLRAALKRTSMLTITIDTSAPKETNFSTAVVTGFAPMIQLIQDRTSAKATASFRRYGLRDSQSARAAQRVREDTEGLIAHDALLANAVVLDQGSSRIAIVSVDSFGWMNEEVLAIQERLTERGVELDHLILHSTHSHASPDTLGIYGPSTTTSGFNEEYAAQVHEQVADAVEQAIAALVPVEMVVGVADLSRTSPNGVANYVTDTRDPWIIDPTIGVIQLADESSGSVVATLVNWSNHPEASASRHSLLSADFVHGLRTAITDGSTWDSYSRSGIGGVCVYLNGTVGGMMTPLRVSNEDPDGVIREEASFEKADAIGLQAKSCWTRSKRALLSRSLGYGLPNNSSICPSRIQPCKRCICSMCSNGKPTTTKRTSRLPPPMCQRY